jgi:hypothetical protein
LKTFAAILFGWIALVSTAGAIFTDSFSTTPNAWHTQNPGAVQWDSSAQNLAVTWDSRQTNSFFYYTLPFALHRQDAFSFELTLQLQDVAVGIDPAKKSTFELCFGFVDLAQALRTNYFRGSGVNSTNGARGLVEFDYFPDSGFGATIGPVVVSTNGQFAYSHTFPVELTPGETYRIRCAFDPVAQVLNTTLVHNGEAIPIAPVNFTGDFADFRVDAFSIHSYSDAGQSPPQFAGSLLAHGTIDDVTVTWPDPPTPELSLRRVDLSWIVSLDGKTGWVYTMERSIDLVNWEAITAGFGKNARLDLTDADPPVARSFYRVNVTRQ